MENMIKQIVDNYNKMRLIVMKQSKNIEDIQDKLSNIEKELHTTHGKVHWIGNKLNKQQQVVEKEVTTVVNTNTPVTGGQFFNRGEIWFTLKNASEEQVKDMLKQNVHPEFIYHFIRQKYDYKYIIKLAYDIGLLYQ